MKIKAVSTEGGDIWMLVDDIEHANFREPIMDHGETKDGDPTHIQTWDEKKAGFRMISLFDAKKQFDVEQQDVSGYDDDIYPETTKWLKENITTEELVQFFRSNPLGKGLVVMTILERCPFEIRKKDEAISWCAVCNKYYLPGNPCPQGGEHNG